MRQPKQRDPRATICIILERSKMHLAEQPCDKSLCGEILFADNAKVEVDLDTFDAGMSPEHFCSGCALVATLMQNKIDFNLISPPIKEG